MSSEPRTWVERHEPEWLCLRCFDDFPDVDVHPVEDGLQLVDEGDVDRPEDVLEELAGLGYPRARDRHDPLERRAVKRRSRSRGGLVHPADDLGDVARRELLVSGIFALWRKCQEEIVRATQPGGTEDWLDRFI